MEVLRAGMGSLRAERAERRGAEGGVRGVEYGAKGGDMEALSARGVVPARERRGMEERKEACRAGTMEALTK